MNERILDLANKATSYCDTLDVADQTIYQDIWKREFAELIIKESISVMQQHDYHGEWLGEKLKEHFGVEE